MRPKKSTLPGLRRAKSRFRFDKFRDDLNLGLKTAYVFTTRSPILDGGDVGVFGAPCGVLLGYERTGTDLLSVQQASGFIQGRVVEVTLDELARLDAVAELSGDFHRFQADIRLPQAGHTLTAWVYQLLSDASAGDMLMSATNQQPGVPAHAL